MVVQWRLKVDRGFGLGGRLMKVEEEEICDEVEEADWGRGRMRLSLLCGKIWKRSEVKVFF